ncbi:calcium-binding protein [Salipiger mucosus]|uniref:Alkaline phosphatase n=1 Tax=Salipiger mucosus DSM 16094 TaxID=1123237 RepID=S9RVG5_9RHOB|nr:calcium-binding protein [Salipiger mucosus]EPX82000.1 Alkaline phosphatase [Salipiger mucosus DSM 16094]
MALIEGDSTSEFLEGTNGNDVIRGFGGDDEIRGLAGNDRLEGGDGGDTLDGGAGNDSMFGGTGVDWFRESAGDDTFNGGEGRDRLDYREAVAGISANLATGVATDGTGGTDTLIDIFRLIGSEFDDVMRGDDLHNSFTGEGGDDLIDGRGGWDFVYYGRAGAAVTVDLDSGVVTGGEGNDTLRGIEGLSGSAFADVLLGNADDNYFQPDVIDGGGSAGTGGADTIDGRGGLDEVSYETSPAGVEVDLGAGTAHDGFGFVDSLRNVEGVWDSPHDDEITGTDGPNVFRDTGGNDSMLGLDGDDVFINLGGGLDTYVGGAGSDTLVTDLTGLALNVLRFDAIAGTHGRDGAPAGALDTVDGIENFSMIGDWNGILVGDDGANSLVSDAGDDTLTGNDGNDTLSGGGGANVIDGGPGRDLLDFADVEGRAFADLRIDQRGAAFLRFYDVGQPQGDTYAGIEDIAGGDWADNLRGDGGANHLAGGGVSDRLYGRAGDDQLDGGTGADALYGNTGADVMTGGPDEGRRDRYIYFQAEESGTGAGNRDVITDFVAGEDRIELSRFDADTTQGFKQAFDFIGDAAFSAAGQLGYRHEGGNTIVQADFDGDGAADFEIELGGVMDLSAGDFLI